MDTDPIEDSQLKSKVKPSQVAEMHNSDPTSNSSHVDPSLEVVASIPAFPSTNQKSAHRTPPFASASRIEAQLEGYRSSLRTPGLQAMTDGFVDSEKCLPSTKGKARTVTTRRKRNTRKSIAPSKNGLLLVTGALPPPAVPMPTPEVAPTAIAQLPLMHGPPETNLERGDSTGPERVWNPEHPVMPLRRVPGDGQDRDTQSVLQLASVTAPRRENTESESSESVMAIDQDDSERGEGTDSEFNQIGPSSYFGDAMDRLNGTDPPWSYSL